jgi:galactokinase
MLKRSYEDMISRFKVRFDHTPELLVEAPGRVNLIGGSTDYNQGFVLPTAIDRKTLFLARNRSDDLLEVYSSTISSRGTLKIDGQEKAQSWLRYLSGILSEMHSRGCKVRGLDLLIEGDLPIGSGLGSSAALEVGFLTVLKHLNNLDVPDQEVVEICHRVENDFVGMKCGVMDQFASTMGKEDSAILLDCRDMTFEYIELGRAISILLFDSGVRRDLVNSDYNTRQAECFDALAEIKTHKPHVQALRDLKPEDIPWLETILEQVSFRRCRHVITEIDRVRTAAEVLKKNNVNKLGKLVDKSHLSLRDDFEVSCAELDHLFITAGKQRGVYGARLTGAGFGGSLLVLCSPSAVEETVRNISHSFRNSFGTLPETIHCRSSDGVKARWIRSPAIPPGGDIPDQC